MRAIAIAHCRVIIEYCEPGDTVKREQYYLDHFDFYYNVLAKADSLLGYKHTNETLGKMKGRQNVLGYKHTTETKNKLRDHQTNKTHTDIAKNKMKNVWAERKSKNIPLLSPSLGFFAEETYEENLSVVKAKFGARKPIKGKIVVVTSKETNLSIEFISISEAASFLNVTRVTLRTYIKTQKVLTIIKQLPSPDGGTAKEDFLITLKNN